MKIVLGFILIYEVLLKIWKFLNTYWMHLKYFRCKISSKYMYEPKVKFSLPMRSIPHAVLSVRFEVGVSLLLAPTGADKRGPKVPFPLVENALIQLAIRKRVLAGAPVGTGSYWKLCHGFISSLQYENEMTAS